MPRPSAPAWLMGCTMASFGFYGGVVAIASPELLAARHVPAERIAALTALLMLPGATSFLLAPVLDVRFSRRAYAFWLALLGAACFAFALLHVGSTGLYIASVLVGYLAICLYQSALGGWYASVVPDADQPTLSSFINVANIGAGGLMAVLTTELLHALPLPAVAIILGALILLPTAVFPFIPAPGPDRMLARESFRALFKATTAMLGRKQVLLVLLLFLLPSSSFTLTNLLAGYGDAFHASEREVSWLGGAGVAIAGVIASLLGRPLCARLPLRRLYLAVGIIGGLFTLGLVWLPHTAFTFGIAMIGENAFQALAFTVSTAIALRTVGHGNPVAATEYGILISAINISLSYMQFVDAHFYATHALPGVFTADAGISIAVCSGLLALLAVLHRRRTAILSPELAPAITSS